MRVISGSLRGLRLESPDGMDTRPTLDRVKEALFSMLFGRTQDAVGLDLFAGSGALGIELLSRYGRECSFVDSDPRALGVARANAEKARLGDRAIFYGKSFDAFLESTDKQFDIIFMDPPYDKELYEPALDIIRRRKLLAHGGVIVCECKSDYIPLSDGFDVVKDKTYGKVRLCILEEA